MQTTKTTATHSVDSDCAGHVDSDGTCTVCHAGGGDPCPACNGVRYHAAWCDGVSDSGGVPQSAEEEHTAPLESQTRPLAYQPIGDVLWNWAQTQKREAARI